MLFFSLGEHLPRLSSVHYPRIIPDQEALNRKRTGKNPTIFHERGVSLVAN
jgi:hypothetical protein